MYVIGRDTNSSFWSVAPSLAQSHLLNAAFARTIDDNTAFQIQRYSFKGNRLDYGKVGCAVTQCPKGLARETNG